VDVHDGVSGFDFAFYRMIFGKFNLHRLCLIGDQHDAETECVECVFAAVYVDTMHDKRGSCAGSVEVVSKFCALGRQNCAIGGALKCHRALDWCASLANHVISAVAIGVGAADDSVLSGGKADVIDHVGDEVDGDGV
jgi:hypothetical protein